MSLSRKLFYRLPPRLRFLARRIYFLPTDLYEGWTGKRDKLTPPKGLIYTGSGDFRQTGEQVLSFMKDLGGLQPHHNVLDVGSGIGRIAIPLAKFLNSPGSYEGFDVVELGVRWCQEKITLKYPNFNFQYIPLENDLYRASGQNAAQFRFPYANKSFDFVVLNSVFTHMLPEQVDNYLHEIQRVLKPKGRCLATFFILNETSKGLMIDNPSFNFRYDYGHYRLMDETVQSANVAFEEDYLLEQLIEGNELNIRSVYYGYWCGRLKADCLSFQDMIVMEKGNEGEKE